MIENRGGASGSVGAIEAARAAPDGYTWLLAYDNEATNQTVMRLPYKLAEAFVPVTLVATGPLALVAHQSTPWQNFRDLVAAAKAAPDTISFASAANRSVGASPPNERQGPCAVPNVECMAVRG